MTGWDHLRAVLATVNDKAHATPDVQDVIERARKALAEAAPAPVADQRAAFVQALQAGERARKALAEAAPAPVADQRAAFVQALQAGPVSAPDAQGATQLGGDQERPATGSVVRSTGCSEMEQVPE